MEEGRCGILEGRKRRKEEGGKEPAKEERGAGMKEEGRGGKRE